MATIVKYVRRLIADMLRVKKRLDRVEEQNKKLMILLKVIIAKGKHTSPSKVFAWENVNHALSEFIEQQLPSEEVKESPDLIGELIKKNTKIIGTKVGKNSSQE